LIETEWKQTRQEPGKSPSDGPGRFWDSRVSVPIPARWPPEGNRPVLRYLYATCFDPQIADGIRVAAPWGCIEYYGGDEDSPRFVRLSESVREIGIQGVRPLSVKELAIYENGAMAESFVESLNRLPGENDPGTPALREYYRTWCGHNGVIQQEIAYRHEPFFRWVGCLR
jgi:hypothetical protein